jgi:hypothetical protein
MRTLLIVVISALSCACASVDPQQFRGPNGKTAYSMKCSGMGRTLDACYKKAGEVCPDGYNIIDRASGTVAVPVSGGGIMAAPSHRLAVECR